MRERVFDRVYKEKAIMLHLTENAVGGARRAAHEEKSRTALVPARPFSARSFRVLRSLGLFLDSPTIAPELASMREIGAARPCVLGTLHSW